ncbi:MAG: hypothetical protein ACRDG7_15130 [Candidatus Limnocylindria bacterium]
MSMIAGAGGPSGVASVPASSAPAAGMVTARSIICASTLACRFIGTLEGMPVSGVGMAEGAHAPIRW